MAYKRLGEILLSAGMITEAQLDKALKDAKAEGKRLGEFLIDKNTITEAQLIDVLRLQLGVEFIDLTKVNIPTELTQVVPKNLAKKHSVVPVKLIGDTLYLAMADPLNFVAIEEIRSASKKRIIPMIATQKAVERTVVTLYGSEGVSRAIDELSRSIGARDEAEETARRDAEEDSVQAAPAIRLVNSIIERAAAEHASDIHMEPREDGLVVRMRIDGVLHTILTVPKNLQSSIISRVKIMGEMDIAERRMPQDGRASIRISQKDIDLRISTLPTKYGEKIVIRFLEKSETLMTSKGIGLEGEHLTLYKDLIRNANGIILIVGPTGSGKSTTMYTMISDLNTESVNLVTLEDPIEYEISGVNQVQINEKTGMTFAYGLRSILRQDPDIISVGEIRDAETAEIAVRSAITGHLVLSTIHTNSAVATIDRLMDIGVEPYLVASALKGIIAQRLVRRICPHCRKAYKASEDELRLLGIDVPAAGSDGAAGLNGKTGGLGSDGAAGLNNGAGLAGEEDTGITLYKGAGCSECLHTGYRGRTAVFEILVLNTEIKNKIRGNAPHEELVDAVKRSGFKPMLDDCKRLVLDGITTVEEATRILHTTDE